MGPTKSLTFSKVFPKGCLYLGCLRKFAPQFPSIWHGPFGWCHAPLCLLFLGTWRMGPHLGTKTITNSVANYLLDGMTLYQHTTSPPSHHQNTQDVLPVLWRELRELMFRSLGEHTLPFLNGDPVGKPLLDGKHQNRVLWGKYTICRLWRSQQCGLPSLKLTAKAHENPLVSL